MQKQFLLFLVTILFHWGLSAQIIFSEDFEGGSTPPGWTIETMATDGGWNVGTATALSSQFFGIPSNGSSQIAATNDDNCNCDKNLDRFITPRMDFTGMQALFLKFDVYYEDNFYGAQENATVEISLDSITWQEIEDIHGHASWDTHTINLSNYADEDTVYIAFNYSDAGGWLYGLAIDNIIVEIPPDLDADLVEVSNRAFGETNTPFPFSGTVFNNGASEITSLEVAYYINNQSPTVEILDDLNILNAEYYQFELSDPWLPLTAGDYTIDIEIISINGGQDANAANNVRTFDTKIYEKVVPPNKIAEFLGTIPVFTEVANSSDQLNKPTDLDFFPILGKDELWVVNQRTESIGGSTLTIADASTDPSDFLHRVDGNAWHFMSLPTGIAFSEENFNFATSPGVRDANHGGGTFTGPTLWSSDPDIYAQPSGGNGSHLDMLHASPFSMGIASEVDNVFWVYDNWNSDIVRYDFVDDHGPGNDDHGDGIVRRYEDMGISADGDIPNHLILDKSTGWLYIVDNGNDRVLRLDINSGNISSNLPLINEPLAEHSQVSNFNYEVIIEEGLDRPCGIEIMENRLLVGDYETGDIVVYDMENDFVELGRIPTVETGLTGIKIGPKGNIWYTNRSENSLMMVEPGDITSTSEIDEQLQINIAPNPAKGTVTISLSDLKIASEVSVQLKSSTGQSLLSWEKINHNQQLDLSNIPSGVYFLNFQGESFSITKKIIVAK